MKKLILIFLALVATDVLCPYGMQGQSVTEFIQTNNSYRELLSGPKSPEDFSGWLARMRASRDATQELIKSKRGDMPDPYSSPALAWARKSFIQTLMMAHERYFYDPRTGHYTVDKYLDDLARRYGGIDSVLIWPTYPNIGVDDRNQFDYWRDMPEGIAGLKRVVQDFHRRNVRVLLPIMYWDNGTRDEGVPMARRMARLARDIGADGLNGDTMSPVTRDFFTESVALGHPLALEPENGLGESIDSLSWNLLSWGYWWPYQQEPGVDRYKFIEPRHLTHVCDRWAHNRTDMMQYAWFNGAGYETWENIWGIWNGMVPRDAEVLHRMAAIYRVIPELLSSEGYEPFTPVVQPGVYATKFPGTEATLWTFINRADHPRVGAQIAVPNVADQRYFNAWNGNRLSPKIVGDKAVLSFDLEPNGYGAVLATGKHTEKHIKLLLLSMNNRPAKNVQQLSSEWQVLNQKMVEIAPTRPARGTPQGMVLIPGGRFVFETEGVMIEKSEGVDVQFPWEAKPALKHKHELLMKRYYIDRTPVTCAEFKKFLTSTRYRPKDRHNFLRNWNDKQMYPEGWDDKPVTWVSIEDARAYARWAGKRLPHEWEWQYAAQGTDGRLYPWGSQADTNRVPPFDSGRAQRAPTSVHAFPQGASPFGVLDMVGNVWQWTDEFQDEHTRAAILKGGSYYRPDKSEWYFPQARQLNQHGKYLLMAPSLDRSATIGFRCVMDTESVPTR